jgi:hypothetical protein
MTIIPALGFCATLRSVVDSRCLAVVLDWFSDRVLSWGVSISTDGEGAWRDNVFVGGCGAASRTRRFNSEPTTPHRRRAHRGRREGSALSLTPADAPLIDA